MSEFGKFLLASNILASCFSLAAGADTVSSSVTVRLYTDVQLSPKTLAQVEQEEVRILRQAGVETVWVECKSSVSDRDPRCQIPPGPGYFVVRIVPKAHKAADSIFGVAYLANGSGAYSDVFYDSVEKLHQECGASTERVLGHVIAHELGHLLLGSNAHTESGIMRPHWYAEQLHALERGALFFTPEQARKILSR